MKRESPQTREQLMDERAAADMASMDRSNSRPLDLAMLAASPWDGSAGFSLNGWPITRVTRVTRVVRRRKRRK
jgi:hypothetical protein